MLLFATSDKGGTGRSVTSANVCYRRALRGSDVAYLDFDFGSPTVGSILNIASAMRGTPRGGLHSYLQGRIEQAERLNVWVASERPSLRGRPGGAGKFVLLPGDEGGGEFAASDEIIDRCADLFVRVDEEFDVCLVDLSAGRSYAVDMALAATARPELREVSSRWLVFHRWTRQHVIAAHGLVHGARGIIEQGAEHGHDKAALASSIRFVRTAVVDPDSDSLAGMRAEQVAWLRKIDEQLRLDASDLQLGDTYRIGSVPLDPVLQWREQLLSDEDINARKHANRETVEAFSQIAARLDDRAAWETL